MSRQFDSRNYQEDYDFGNDFDDEVFMSHDEDENKDGHDCMLGSRLEDELNRSIEKMRQMENGDKMDDVNIRVENLLDSDTSGTSPLGKSVKGSHSDELIEDIEMPSFSESGCESAELVSISSGSPQRHVNQDSNFWSGRSGTSFSGTAMRGRVTNSSYQMTSSLEKKEMDLCERIALLSAPLEQKYTRLVSLGEDDAANKHTAKAGHDSSKDEMKDDEATGNKTSSPLSCSSHTSSSLEVLDMDNLNYDLLSSLMLENSPIKQLLVGDNLQSTVKDLQKEIANVMTSENPVEVKDGKQESDKANPMLNDPSSFIDWNSLPRARRMTLNSADEIIYLEELNDSLLSSYEMAKSPIKLDGHDVRLPSSFMSVGKEIMKIAAENKTQSENTKQNNSSFEKLPDDFNTLQSLGNKSKSIDDLPKEIKSNIFGSLENTFSCLSDLLAGKDNKGVLQNPNTALDSTYEMKRSKTTLSCGDLKEHTINKGETTFITKGNPKVLLNNDANQTFCAKPTLPVNTTFDAKKTPVVDTTFDLKASQANVTFDKKDVNTDGMESPLSRNDQNDADNLNVTFEKGEYRIASLNKTVNLMDAEENVLQLILGSTPLKASKLHPGASSTPKDSNRLDAAAKRTVTKDSSQTFFQRMSQGMRKTCQNTGEDREKRDSSNGEQSAGPNSVMSGLKMGFVNQQTVTNQLRRLHSGLARTASGPMRALPLTGISVGSTGDKSQKDNSSQGDLDGIRTLDNTSQIGTESRKHKLPSFGSISSLDSDQPGTLDGYKPGSVTPDLFRPSSCNMSPRVTSTPAFKIRGSHTNVVLMDGPAPTPIAASPKRSRFGTMSASSCSAVEQDNPLWMGFSKTSTESSVGSLNTPAKKTSALPVRPSRMCSPASLAAVATPEEQEEYHNAQDIGEDSGIKPIDDEEDNCVPSQPNMDTVFHDVNTKSVNNVKTDELNKRLEVSEDVIIVKQNMNVTSQILNGSNPAQQMNKEVTSVMDTQKKSCQNPNKTIELCFNKEDHRSPLNVKQDHPSTGVCKEIVACIPLSKSNHKYQIDGDGLNVEAVNQTPISVSQTKEIECGQGSSLNCTVSHQKETTSEEMNTVGQDTEGNGKDQVDEPQNLDHTGENVSENTCRTPEGNQAKTVQASSKSAVSKGKISADSRRSTTRATSRTSLSSKSLAANKENIAKNDTKSNANSQPKVNVRGKRPALNEKLPSHQTKAPLRHQALTMHKAGNEKKTVIQKVTTENIKASATKGTPIKKGAIANSQKGELKAPVANSQKGKLKAPVANSQKGKLKAPVANSQKGDLKAPTGIAKLEDAVLEIAVTKDIPVSQASKLKAPQQIPVSKLPLGSRIPTGVPVRGMVKSSSCDPSSFKHLQSRLPGTGIRPPNSSNPVLPAKSLSSGSLRIGIALPSTSKLAKPQKPS